MRSKPIVIRHQVSHPRNQGRMLCRGLFALCLTCCIPPMLHAAECNFNESNRIHAWSAAAAQARPARVVVPVYPPDLLRQGVTGKAVIQLRIGRNGGVSEVLAIKAETGNSAFEKAVLAVTPYWQFRPGINCECQPVSSTEELSVWFAIKEGRPDISVTRPAPPETNASSGERPLMITGIKNARSVFADAYPRSAQKAGEEGSVYGIVVIDSETGIAQGMDVTHVEANPDFRTAFSKATQIAVKGLKFGFEGTPPVSPFRGCFEISYRLQN